MRLIDADLFDKELKEYSDAHYDEEFYTCESIRDMLEDAPTVNPYEWISVKDRLPEQFGKCLVGCKGIDIAQIRLYEGTWDSLAEVTHWMPLPTPPAEKEN